MGGHDVTQPASSVTHRGQMRPNRHIHPQYGRQPRRPGGCHRIPAEAAARMLALIARAADPGDEEEAAPREADALFGAAEVTGVKS
jgi:hypothetical protein